MQLAYAGILFKSVGLVSVTGGLWIHKLDQIGAGISKTNPIKNSSMGPPPLWILPVLKCFPAWSEGIHPQWIDLGVSSLPWLGSGLIPEILHSSLGWALFISRHPCWQPTALCALAERMAPALMTAHSRESELLFHRNYSMENVNEIWWNCVMR